MLSGRNRIISKIYERGWLWVVPVSAALLSLCISLVMYCGAVTEPSPTPLWLRAWIVSLPIMAIYAPLFSFLVRKGVRVWVSFAVVAVVMAAIACVVYGCCMAEETVLWRRICAGQLVCTIPYLVSCALFLAVRRVVYMSEGGVEPERYSSVRMDFLSERGKVELSITSDRFLYMESRSNYLTVAYLDSSPKGVARVATKRIRSSLKSVEARFARLPLVKANRSCIVNGERIYYMVREGRGGMLKLHGCDDTIRISQHNYNALAEYVRQSGMT